MPSKRKRRHANAPDVEADVEASSAAGLSFDETVRLAAQEEATRRINEQDAERVAMGQEQEQSEEPVEQPSEARSSVRAPLPDDVTAEELAARPKQPANPRKRDTPEDTYKNARNKWWPKFCAHAGWDTTAKLVLLDLDGSPIDGTFRQFLIWLYEEEVGKSVFKGCMQWMQAELNRQRVARLLQPMKEHVCNVPGVKERKDEIYSKQRQLHILHMDDLQAEIESNIGTEKMLELVDTCLQLNISGTNGLFCCQALFELRASHQQCARHDDLRDEMLAHIFCRSTKAVAFGNRSMPMLCNVTDGGKTNQNGRISYSAVLPAKNPALCTIFAKGIAFVWRFCVMKVSFPELLKPEDIFRRPTLRQALLCHQQYLPAPNLFFRALLAVCSKSTGRRGTLDSRARCGGGRGRGPRGTKTHSHHTAPRNCR